MNGGEITPEMREEEPFRWCVFCDTDCEVDDPEHATDCPSVTGLFPVRDEDVYESGAPCDNCGHRNYVGMRCAECNAEMKIGDHYCLQSTERDDTKIIVCPGCVILKPEVSND